jgi:hypothetical protein
MLGKPLKQIAIKETLSNLMFFPCWFKTAGSRNGYVKLVGDNTDLRAQAMKQTFSSEDRQCDLEYDIGTQISLHKKDTHDIHRLSGYRPNTSVDEATGPKDHHADRLRL